MMTERRWQDIGSLVVGGWLFVSPMVIGAMSDMPIAAWNAYILGAGIIVFAAIAVSMPRAWEEGINMALGVWMIISPWVLGFASQRNLAANAVIAGVLVTVLATVAMVHDKGFEQWWHDHHIAS